MPKNLVQKNIRLSNEFDQCVVNHPTAYRRIPHGAHVVITSSKDKKLSEANRAIARCAKSGKFVEAHKTDKDWRIKEFAK